MTFPPYLAQKHDQFLQSLGLLRWLEQKQLQQSFIVLVLLDKLGNACNIRVK